MNSKRKSQAKSPHTWNRRDFSVGSAGYFTVLKPAGWSAASRLPGGFRYLGGQPKAVESTHAPEQIAESPSGSQGATIRLQTIEPGTHDHPVTRPALIVLGAAAITAILLWWTAFPRFH
jgi:hypothetical protein